eukprot:COSAG01_NODE_7715_length_3048_cov_7.664324_3_plen_107_part_00
MLLHQHGLFKACCLQGDKVLPGEPLVELDTPDGDFESQAAKLLEIEVDISPIRCCFCLCSTLPEPVIGVPCTGRSKEIKRTLRHHYRRLESSSLTPSTQMVDSVCR